MQGEFRARAEEKEEMSVFLQLRKMEKSSFLPTRKLAKKIGNGE